ncbi:hypothetical protein MHU86_20768 [Fragilaria crotonensis]|nr:hypothetical protein MHU86_20768 [Fragilaria crotonensis]
MNLLVPSVLVLCMGSASAVISPTRISYESIVNHRDADRLLHALETVGIVSITNIPHLHKKSLLQSLPECIKKIGVESTFADGTIRRTIATHSQGSHMWDATTNGDESCQSFASQNGAFRSVIGQVVSDFGLFLEDALSLKTSLLQHTTRKDETFSLVDIVHQGDHLEHFHAYYTSTMHDTDLDTTIDWHIDQGLLLAFSPGQSSGQTTDGFFIQLEDGSTETVRFDQEDEIVFFFGDGANQIINPVLIKHGRSPMRVLPHALKMPRLDEERLWYGRMVLAPADALHPVHLKSFGDIRNNMIQQDEDYLSIGCSSSAVARLLHEDENTACNETMSSYCWHSCMNYTDYDASPDLCTGRALMFGCVDEDGNEWPDTHNASFMLRCVETIIPVSNESGTHDDDHLDHDDGGAGGRKNTTTGGGGGGSGKSVAHISLLSRAAVLLAGIAGFAGCM